MSSRALALRWSCAVAVLVAAATTALASDPWGLFPESASLEADRVDGLTYLILWITGITLVGVQVCMLWFLWAYRRKDGVRAKHTHGNHTVEMVWTVAPAAILVFLALYQMGLWKDLKSSKPGDNENAVAVRIYAKQFEWMFRYPGPDAQFDTADDIFSNKTLVVPVNHPVNAELRAMDVIHSFYLPNMRFKQDAVPGLHGRIWFRPNKLSIDRKPLRSSRGAEVKVDYFDIVCAELCGSQHTTMAAKLYVVSDDEFAKWQKGDEVTLASGTKIPRPSRTDALQSPYDFIWSTWAMQDDLKVVAPPKWHKGGPFYPDYKGDEE
ncbi:MAG: cytochrome c oxidase subunit II [Planctomycetes bacterium]|nr:cytochrome c oxidase subunit II [Planctomycetota bacterium]